MKLWALMTVLFAGLHAGATWLMDRAVQAVVVPHLAAQGNVSGADLLLIRFLKLLVEPVATIRQALATDAGSFIDWLFFFANSAVWGMVFAALWVAVTAIRRPRRHRAFQHG